MTNRKKSLKFAQIIRKFMFKTGMQLRDKRQIFFNLNVLKKKKLKNKDISWREKILK